MPSDPDKKSVPSNNPGSPGKPGSRGARPGQRRDENNDSSKTGTPSGGEVDDQDDLDAGNERPNTGARKPADTGRKNAPRD